MNKDIQAKVTFYNGYKFRSRLEAKWAIFFDSLNWHWEYETKDFVLPSGRYLPDFYFPDIDMFGEVKAKELNELELLKCKELSLHINEVKGGLDVLLLEGMPSFTSYRTVSEGQISFNVVCMPNSNKFYPFYYSPFCPDYCSDTAKAVFDAREAQFEFLDRRNK